MTEKELLSGQDISRIVADLSKKIYEDIEDIERFAVVGIQSSGVELASRINKEIEFLSGKKVKQGILDITFYRDDLATRGILPVIKETRIDFNISKMTILLVDDVIFTGRTTKAALETIMSFGRPSSIKLFCLIDRGNRELPIQPDYCGYTVQTTFEDKINVMLQGDGEAGDSVIMVEND